MKNETVAETLGSEHVCFFCGSPEQQLSDNLKQDPNSLEDLKSVLGTISDIRAMSLTVEMRLADIQEKYRTLAMYNVEVITSLRPRWV